MGLLATSVMLTTACSDSFLEVENPSGEPLEEYYTTDAHIQEALYAAYDPTHWYDWGLGQYNALNIDAEVMGDNFWVGGANKGDMAHMAQALQFRGKRKRDIQLTVDSGLLRHQAL